MKTIIYPAIFHVAEEGGYFVTFPDLEGCVTQGETLEEALLMAADALFVWTETMEELPAPSSIADVKAEQGAFMSLVKAELYEGVSLCQKDLIAREVEIGLKTKGYTKGQAATILAVDRSYLTHIVKGDRVPSVEMAKRIALLLGFDWKVFFAETV